MAKNSLIIGEDEKYGKSSEGPVMPGEKSKAKKRKFAPSIQLTASQIEAFGLDDATQGQTGCALIHYIVKAVDAGGSGYGDELPDPKQDKKVSISITHVNPDCESAGGEDNEDDAEDEKAADDDSPPTVDSDDDDAEDEESAPKAPSKETMSPADALGEND